MDGYIDLDISLVRSTFPNLEKELSLFGNEITAAYDMDGFVNSGNAETGASISKWRLSLETFTLLQLLSFPHLSLSPFDYQ